MQLEPVCVVANPVAIATPQGGTASAPLKRLASAQTDHVVRLAPPFDPRHPMPWLKFQTNEKSAKYHLDPKPVLAGVVAGEAAKKLVRYGYVGAEIVTISRTVGLRAMAAEVGWKGIARRGATALGKGVAWGYVAQGVLMVGGVGLGAAMYQYRALKAKNTTHSPVP